MKQVVLKPLVRDGQACIGIYFDNYPSLNSVIYKEAGARWSRRNKCWYVPLNTDSFHKLCSVLAGKAELNTTEIKEYLEQRKHTVANPIQETPKKKFFR